MRQWIALSLLCMISLLLPISASAVCESPIKIGALTWESGQFTSGVLKYIAEEGYGCTVEEVPGAGPALDTALSQNDIQVIGEQWVGRSPIMEQAIEQNKVAIIGDTLKGGATQGWYVPDYVLEENPGLRSYQDLPKYAELFKDPEDPSKSRFMNCPSGWTCEIFNTRLLKTTGLDSTFNNAHPGTGAALDAVISSAFEQHKPLLFYYWQPTGLMAKYDFAPLAFPAHNDACWQDLLRADGAMDCVSGFPVSPLGIAVSTPFIESNPELADVFKKIQFTSDELNGAILEMSESKRSGDEQALVFLRENPNVWQKWLSDEAATNLAAKLGISLTGDAIDSTAVNNNSASDNQLGLASSFPSWSLETPLNNTLASVVQNYGDVFRSISTMALTYLLLPIERLLTVIPPWLIIAFVTVLGWFGVRKVWFALACGAGLFLIGAFGLWGALIDTFALLIVSVLVTVVIGIPIGIAMAGSKLLRKIVTPILDVMQTMPSFVYLIPVLMLFGIGKVPALFATIIYALPPLIRLTTLGITQVNHEMVEAGRSFGSTHLQLLIWIKLPQALPSIMAGVNQAVMMSLSMVVLASMIGAPGLGEDVLQSIQTLNIGQGLQAGTAIVIVAIIIDRITQAFGQGKRARQKTIDASRHSIG
ncbi:MULTISPECIES: glycine betaine ABC transporter substrate-binding protein [unclassified Psychrobacter]|uniref:glycine betaine ABC transporter substrate-binding protein n=1 Tax=unclassified Psychrobacter TaxID=196806 RepID=UPI0025B6172F|nr:MULTISPECIES: glycine betaine ABC transporter substrate-binding protein [unclassified Psychrobacter]MDN3452960.1 glycine betaine ABC transporter substrate-binding protein [Psychrobacter sp. APC 3350]MDN3501519.1 glycine betaine ABC transporter substrate-binding protein [Psychrobacter sp. 5A.1]